MVKKLEEKSFTAVVADSNVQDRESKVKTMMHKGIRVLLSTGDGNKALDAIRKYSPDVVVMDLILPGIDGLGILEQMQEFESKEKPKIIIQTALRMSNLVEEALNCGADYYMMKPISNTVLIERMGQLLHDNQKKDTSGVVKEFSIYGKKNGKENRVQLDKIHSQMEDQGSYAYSGDLERDVTNILLEIGIPAHIKGYQYIREGIIMSFYDRNMLQYITKFLYPSIAKKYKTTSSSVERTIRHAIEVAWRRGNMDILEEIFGNTICSGKGKPTNSEFMALLTDKLRLEYRTKNIS